MNKRELARRARYAAAELIENGLFNGVAILLTDNGTEEEIEEATQALRAVKHMLMRSLPEGFAYAYRPPADEEELN